MSLQPRCPIAAAITVFWLLTAACSSPEPKKPQAEPTGLEEGGEHEEGIVQLTPEAAAQIEIRTVPAEQRILAAELGTTGQVDFDQTRLAHVSPRISGRVHRVRASLGQQVRAGQTLAEIDSIELGQAKAVYLQAKASEDLARRSFERTQSLFADRIVSEQEALEAEARLREVAAALRTAEETLHLYGLSQGQVDALTYDDGGTSIYPLRAPFAGTIVERHATLGELVTPERNLFTLADLSRVWIWIDVYQRDLAGVHLDDQAQARVDAFPDQVFTGTVSYLSARVDADTRTVRARLDVANPEGKLRPGMFVEVGLVDPHDQQGRGEQTTSLVVPEDAVVRDGGDFLVFVAASENRFERRAVRVGRKVGGYAEILPGTGPGIRPGEAVVVEGSFLLKSAAAKESLGGGHDH
jgi:cobalt-zinc-cadmium efflux system membrane fusion protein